MKQTDGMKQQTGDVTIKIPYNLCYHRYGEKTEKTISIKYGIPRAIAQDIDLNSLEISQEMAAVIYEAEREMETERKRKIDKKIGCYVEGISETAMRYDVNDVYGKVENRFLRAEIVNVLKQLRPKHRKRVILYHFIGYTVKEISDMESKTPRAIRASLRISEKKLGELLEKTSLFGFPTD